jgi:hypothetical protein
MSLQNGVAQTQLPCTCHQGRLGSSVQNTLQIYGQLGQVHKPVVVRSWPAAATTAGRASADLGLADLAVEYSTSASNTLVHVATHEQAPRVTPRADATQPWYFEHSNSSVNKQILAFMYANDSYAARS